MGFSENDIKRILSPFYKKLNDICSRIDNLAPEPIDPPVDYEITCVQENDSLYLVKIEEGVVSVIDFTGAPASVTPTRCSGATFDTEKEFFCIDGIDYTRNDTIQKDNTGAIVSIVPFWQDNSGAVIPDPTIGAIIINKGGCNCTTEIMTVEQKYDIITVPSPICTGGVLTSRIETGSVGDEYTITLNINGVDQSQSFTNVSVLQMNSDVASWASATAGGVWNFNFGSDSGGTLGAIGFDWQNVPNLLGSFNITRTTTTSTGVTFDLSSSCTSTGVGTQECIPIQEVKEKQCDGTETYRFIVEDGSGQLIEYILQGELSNECVALCSPATESFTGNAATLTEFDSYQILVSSCCEITITTSAGTIVLPAQSAPYSFNQKFECMISGYTISGDCVKSVTTILTKSK